MLKDFDRGAVDNSVTGAGLIDLLQKSQIGERNPKVLLSERPPEVELSDSQSLFQEV